MPDDYSAMGAFNAVKEMGLSVPEDISIVGYDGIAYSQLLSKAYDLSSGHRPYRCNSRKTAGITDRKPTDHL